MAGKAPVLSLLAGTFLAAGILLAQAEVGPGASPPFPPLSLHLKETLPSSPESRTQELILGIETTTSMYYKLTCDDQVISAGLLPRGTSYIPFSLVILLGPVQTYAYNLEARWRDRVAEKLVQITVITEGTGGTSEEKRIPVSIPALLSLYLGNRLLYQESKYTFGPLGRINFQRMPGTDPKPNPSAITNPSPLPSSIPLLTLAAAALAKIHENKQLRRLRKMEIESRKKQVLEWVLVQKEPDGSSREVKARIQLQVKNRAAAVSRLP